jgi:hypothetical protein
MLIIEQIEYVIARIRMFNIWFQLIGDLVTLVSHEDHSLETFH